MEDKPLISIITPVYNAEKFLKKCIQSIMDQTYKNWELILIDDGSPDNSGAICDIFAKKDSRITAYHKKNGGPSSARNIGLDYAKGEYIWFVDSDDWIESDAIEHIVNLCKKTKVDICFFELKTDSENNNSAPYSFREICKSKEYILCKDENCAELIPLIELAKGMGWTCNKLFKNELIQTYQLRFDCRFSKQEDHLFTLSYLIYVKSILVTTFAPYNYSIYEGSLVSRSYPYLNTKERNLAMYELRCELCKKKNITDERYISWFISDYANRTVFNLRHLKSSGLNFRDKKKEIKEVNKFLSTHSVNLRGKPRLYNYIYWLPVWLIAKLL